MKNNTLPLIASMAAVVTGLIAGDAYAYDLGSSGQSSTEITGLSPGLKELAFESLFVVGYDKQSDESSIHGSFIGGGTFSYFLFRNFSLGLNGSFLFKKEGVSAEKLTDLGALGSLDAAYNVSLGGGLFIRPLLGVGGFYAKRTTKLADIPFDLNGSTYGAVARPGLHLAFYPSQHFKLHAGPEALVYFGKSTPEHERVEQIIDGQSYVVERQSETYIAVDAAFKVGLSYVF